MADRAPAKKWRVYRASVQGARGTSTDYRSERAAYEAMHAILHDGTTATVRHWENGGWKLYERIDPVKEPWQVLPEETNTND